MTIQLNSGASRACFAFRLKEGRYLLSDDCDDFEEHPTHYVIQDSEDNYVFPKLFYSISENKLYTLFNRRESGPFDEMKDSGLI